MYSTVQTNEQTSEMSRKTNAGAKTIIKMEMIAETYVLRRKSFGRVLLLPLFFLVPVLNRGSQQTCLLPQIVGYAFFSRKQRRSASHVETRGGSQSLEIILTSKKFYCVRIVRHFDVDDAWETL